MSNVQAVTDDKFKAEVLDSKLPVLVDFFAVWCGPCKVIAPAIEQVAADFAGKLKVVKVDVDESPETSSQFGISGVPTLIFFNGGSEATRIVGAVPRDTLVKAVKQLVP